MAATGQIPDFYSITSDIATLKQQNTDILLKLNVIDRHDERIKLLERRNEAEDEKISIAKTLLKGLWVLLVWMFGLISGHLPKILHYLGIQ